MGKRTLPGEKVTGCQTSYKAEMGIVAKAYPLLMELRMSDG